MYTSLLSLSRRLSHPKLISIPIYQDAPYNETNHRYFEFKRYKIYKGFKISLYFYFYYIIYLL